jgi:multiple sugar transport system permease protein
MNYFRLLKITGRVILYAVLIITALMMAFPLIYGLAGSLASSEDYITQPWFPLPLHPTFTNYYILLGGSVQVSSGTALSTVNTTSFFTWVGNTIFRAAWYIVVTAVIAVMAGYAFSKLKFRGRDTAFLFLLSSMMLPGIVYEVPTFVMMARWPLAGGNNILGQGGTGFINQWPALLIGGLVNVFYIFMFRQTFQSIPVDFEEAARVDGANTLQCLWQIYLPMLKPTITVLIIFTFVGIWNDYRWPLFVSTGNKDIRTIALGFQDLANAGNYYKGLPGTVIDYPFMFALAMVSIAPLIIMYFFLQRYFVEGVQGFAIKG